MHGVDSLQLNFESHTLFVMNISLALIMFGISLNLDSSDFKRAWQTPSSYFIGLFSQIIALPLITFMLILIFKPTASIALGMILVAACPGGNLSNFLSSYSGSNTALSIGMTITVSFLAAIITPFNVEFYGNLYAPTQAILETIKMDYLEIAKTIFLIIILPLSIGMQCKKYFPKFSAKLHRIMQYASVLFFISLIILAFMNNIDNFKKYISYVLLLVFVHNATAIASGYGLGRIFKRSKWDSRTIGIETGIQNSGLGLVLIFSFFNGLGGMALVAAWWGIWHIISGLSVAWYWKRNPVK